MTDERQRESRANLRSGLENAKEDLKRLREEAAQAADSINSVGTDTDAVIRLLEKIKVARQKVCVLREANSELG